MNCRQQRILVAGEDEPTLQWLAQTRSHVITAASGAQAVSLIQDARFDLVIIADPLPGLGGLDLLRFLRQRHSDLPVAILATNPSVEEAVAAMREGAVDYLIKPVDQHRILGLLNHRRSRNPSKPRVIAKSDAMQRVLAAADQAGPTDATVFITGESGTGKEVIAHALHNRSRRRQKAYIRVNCAAVPDTLIESEFFGHERGAFTGAHARKAGRFELADGGTLLLDEVTEIPPAVQPKLLRALQEKEFERVGGISSVTVDVRLIATSNRDIEEALASKAIREDLYYRLRVIPIHIPPLRERSADILPLAHHFLGDSPKRLTEAAERELLAYGWPGNIRELANVIERALVLTEGEIIDADCLELR